MRMAIFDGVFSQPTCSILQAQTQAVGLGHRVFQPADRPRTRLEAALRSVLHQLNDSSTYVEYWTRQPWKHIEAHADVDEKLASQTGELRYPQHGHVLYLAVGSRVRGPTCVFDATRGSELAARRSASTADDTSMEADERMLTIVPAVRGRLLRFNGSLLHAVPAPTDRWLTPFAKNTPVSLEADWQRVVVLFNTWPETPPLGVETGPPQPDVPSHGAGGDYVDVECAPFSRWRSVRVAEAAALRGTEEHHAACEAGSAGSGSVIAKVWLLGDERRRGQASRTVQLRAAAVLGEALAQEHAVVKLTLQAL
jgi:hypothetical protein